MTDKTEAMDNLIAQDADLIETCSKDLVRRLRSTVCQGNLGCHRLVDDDEAADRIEALTAENFKLAAGSCDIEGGKVGDEHGHFYCTLQAKVEAQAAEIERLNKSAECLAESRRLAVKDLAALEGHMRLEIGQWRVDYDCAIMDVKQLREWVTALEVLLDCAVADYCDQNGRPKHDLHWVNQSRAILEQNK
jgi:hypothetical protein